MDTPGLHIHLFGPLRIEREGQILSPPASADARALLAYLVMHSTRPLARSVLVGVFWPDLPEAKARRALSRALWHLRRAIPDLVQAEGDMLVVDPQVPVWVDVNAFRQAAERAFALPPSEEAAAREALEEAVALYQGDLLEGFYDDWALAARERLHDIYLNVRRRLAALYKRAGDYERALEHILVVVAADPLQESGHREAMRLYQRLGRPYAALRQFERCRQVLAEELGLDPEPETVALAREIARRAGAAIPPFVPTMPSQHTAPLLGRKHELPLVGRQAELQALVRRVDAAMAGQGGMVLVAGEAGVGKTRLLHEAARAAEWRGARVLWGHAREHDKDVPFEPLVEVLRCALSGLKAPLPVEPLWLAVVSRLLPEAGQLLPYCPDSATLAPGYETLRLLEALSRTLLALGRLAPTVVILENLQWAEPSTLEALAFMAKDLQHSAVLILSSYRQQEVEMSDEVSRGLLRLQREASLHLALRRLNRDETGLLVRHSLGLTHPVPLFEERIYQETEGNPLFVLETLRAIYDEGLLFRDETGTWCTPWDETTSDYAELPLPPRVGQIIARRLAQLREEERVTLNAAAVLEDDFSFALLRRTSPLDQDATLRALNELIRRQLLIEVDATYHFGHDKIRRVVCEEMPSQEREALHRRAAEALQALHPGRVERLAHHWEQGRRLDQAAYYYLRAGERAAAVHAYATAVTHYDRAIALAQEAGLSPSFHHGLRSLREAALDVLGRREEQMADLEVLERLARGDAKRLMEVHRRRAWLLAHLSRFDEAEAAARMALDLAGDLDDPLGQAAALTVLGMAINWRGDAPRAIPLLRDAVALCRRAGDRKQEAETAHALANALMGMQQYAAARAEAEAALALYETLGDRPGQATVLGTLGIISMEQGAAEEAIAYYRRALEICRAIGFRYDEARNLANWANVLFTDGQIGAALQHYQEAATIFDALGNERGSAAVRVNLAAVYLDVIGDDQAAERNVETALAYHRAAGDRRGEGQCLVTLGEIALRRGALETARQHMEAGLAALEEVGERWMAVLACRALARLALQEGRPRSALAQVEKAQAVCEDLGLAALSVNLLAVRSEALLALGQPEAALAAVEEAVARLVPGVEQAHVVHFQHYRALQAVGRREEARAALERAYHGLQTLLAGLSPEQQRMSRERVPEHRDILAAWEDVQPRLLTVRLPRADAPTGRPLREEEYVEVVWTVATFSDEQIEGKVARRRQRLLRLLREAQAQGAAPTYRHLAEALGVGVRTIERDMAALRRAGHHLLTRHTRRASQ
jgi:DNA-binding SARP family transcriptional activator